MKIQITTCAPMEHGTGGPGRSEHGTKVPLQVRRDGATKVIDIHAHLAVPAADQVLRPYLAQAASFTFSSPDSDAVNREMFARIGAKLHSIEEHIRDMDASGVDIQAISPVPGQLMYTAPPDVGRDAAR